ncbi:hypothetical protein EDD29_8987 [Actinocorallia herbida]|uniref:Uncharacterized protein n=1 Tax=Actinocorallia herbida TaxID=58109 RepID=A0A3N1DCH6_9ACTN|nr:hypothetical protein [Actinocorallia herbida]ROO91235.1 hypothetical protein EDD29_8987 [Actinocorallia herbida]
MLAKLGQVGIAVALVAGGVVAAPGAASAAPKACALGTWTLTKHTFSGTDDGFSLKGSGGKGTKLTVKAGSVKYDFAKSAKVNATGKFDDGEVSIWAQYKKSFTLNGAFKGKKSGTFGYKGSSAKGTATATSGAKGVPGSDTYKLVPAYKKNEAEPIAPLAGKFTCGTKSLHLWFTLKDETGSLKADIWYKR